MGYKDPIKRKEYNKLLRRMQRGSKLAIAGKTILEQMGKGVINEAENKPQE